MTEQEKIVLIETEQRSIENSRRIDNVDCELRDIKNDQKAIYKIASSVELIAQRVGYIEEKVDETNKKADETNKKVDEQIATWRKTEGKLTARINDAEVRPDKEISKTYKSIKISVITIVATTIAVAVVTALISLLK